MSRMQTKDHIYKITLHTSSLARLLLLIGLLFVSGFALVSNTLVSHADSIPGGNVADPFVRAVDIAKPAVVRILTTENSTLTVQFSSGKSVTFPQDNSGGYPLTLSGSGAFITSHGDILTADHVVNPPADPSMKQYLDQLAAQDVADYMSKNGIAQESADQVQQDLDSGKLASSPHYGTASSEVYLSTDYTGPLSASTIDSVPSNLHSTAQIEQQSPFDQKDVAIIHTSFTDTPSIPVGDSSTVQQQDELRIIGFPGNGDVSDNNVPDDFFTLSINQVFVSSVTKKTDSGAPVLQVGGNVEHGDSGGPALSSDGKIVGIVSFGLVSNGEAGSTSFLQASNSARELMQSLNLNTTPGAFQNLWSKAFTEYSLSGPQHWHKAMSDFQTLASSYPLFKGLAPYQSYANTQAATEPTPTPASHKPKPGTGSQPAQQSNSFGSLLLTIGILLLLAFLVILLFMVALRRRGKKPDIKQQAPGAQPQQAPPAPRPAFAAAPQPQPAPQVRPHVVPAPQPPVQPRFVPPVAPQNKPAAQDVDMSAFGGPPGGPITPTPAPPSTISSTLRAWPCGHMNRSNARFCSICGEPAPTPPPPRRVEQ